MSTTMLNRRALLAAGLALPSFAIAGRAGAADAPLKIGVLCDMSGIYADDTGPGLVAAVQVAVNELGGKIGNRPITIVSADDKNKPDVGADIAARWLDKDGVSAIVCASASSITLAVASLCKARNKALLICGSLSSDLTGSQCSPMSFQFSLDTYAGPKSVIAPTIREGAKTWYIINVDYAYGISLRDEGSKMIEASGGKVVGATSFPLGTTDFASQLLQARTSGAQAIALACGGADWSNLCKQAHDFGISEGGQRLVTLTGGINEIQAVGGDLCAGMIASTPFYWDLDEGSRAFSAKFRALLGGRFPNWQQANGYSSVLHWAKAVAAAGTDDGSKVGPAMRATPVKDALIDGAAIRVDGQVMRPTYLVKVKPETAKGRADIFAHVGTLSAEQSWRPAAESACPALKPA